MWNRKGKVVVTPVTNSNTTGVKSKIPRPPKHPRVDGPTKAKAGAGFSPRLGKGGAPQKRPTPTNLGGNVKVGTKG